MALAGLDGKVAVVTGGAGGIGSASARRLSAEGARVVVVDLDAAAAERTAASIGGTAIGVGADVSTVDGVMAYMDAATALTGRVDLVHLNAGYPGKLVPFVATEPEDADRVIAVNLRGVYLGMRAAVRQMLEQGDGGSIVVTSSSAGIGGAPLFGPYSATKHAVIGLVQTVALETAREGIRINAICPGFTDTPMARPAEDTVNSDRAAARAEIESTLPLGRYARPDEIAAAVAWLLSAEASYITGSYLLADGGASVGCVAYKAPEL